MIKGADDTGRLGEIPSAVFDFEELAGVRAHSAAQSTELATPASQHPEFHGIETTRRFNSLSFWRSCGLASGSV